ncbi:unnamed protein product [Arabis nemorensis]|uniref:Uncharacterized protein n=1 Tax=Arabis nemorensis TaxID=586526 RepID=A0A565BWK1_9BRAS|nr:unnamed protein product [Arabis nemorensis]
MECMQELPVHFSFFRMDKHYTAKNNVWWDIENCKVPSKVPPSEMQGGVVLNGETLTGITYHRIPDQEGEKDASDGWIIVEMKKWKAGNNLPPQNVIIFSGDGGRILLVQSKIVIVLS